VQGSPFIFSNKLQWRISRHVAFWIVFFLSQAAVSLVVPTLFNRNNNERIFEASFAQLLYLPGQLFLVYTLLYFVIPKFILQSRYKMAFVWIIILCVVTGFIASLFYWAWVDDIFAFFSGRREAVGEKKAFNAYISMGFINGLRASLVVAGLATSIKLIKQWYEKEYLNTVLQKEKLNAELQSLKAQLHPHFLFNTLNNIYSITQNTSPIASEMLVKLSDLLRYILYQCDQPVVNLCQEFQLIKDYIALEKIRYTNELDVDVSLPANTNGYRIAPLLLLPLVENCFKHGSSRLIEQPWIKIHIEQKENSLLVKLINAKPVTGPGNNFHSGIGLKNLQKRLDLLYPDRHELKIISEPDVFIVNLKVELEKSSNGKAG
jgi:sensor histidine kinase YesM